jgi:hypothetical protein
VEGLAKHGPAAFEALLKQAARAGVQVAALYGWNGDGKDGPFPATAALQFVDDVLALSISQEGTLARVLSGISFDIEPRDQPDPTSYQAYAALLTQVREKLDKANRMRAERWVQKNRVGSRIETPPPPLKLSIAGSW